VRQSVGTRAAGDVVVPRPWRRRLHRFCLSLNLRGP
jgi:hypothetical protein